MVTKLADGRGQTTLKAHAVTDEWEALVKSAAKRNGQTMADFVVTTTTAAAQGILKGASAVPAGVPARPEDVADRLAELMREEFARRDAEQAARSEALAAQLQREQAQTREEMRRAARRGRWRKP